MFETYMWQYQRQTIFFFFYHLYTSNEFFFNFILGMDQTYCDKVEYMTDYFSQIDFYIYQGPAPRIRSRNIPQDFFTCKYEGKEGKHWKSNL